MSSITRTLRLGFALLLFSIVGQSAVGLLTATSNNELVTDAINEDFNRSLLISQIAIEGNKLRRYEKEYFIYVGDAKKMRKYEGEWSASYHKLKNMIAGAMNDSSGAWSSSQKNVLKAWAASLEAYAIGFNEVVQRVHAGSITDTIAANKAVQPAKNKFRVLLNGAEASGADLLARAEFSALAIKRNNAMTIGIFVFSSVIGIALAIWMLISTPRAINRPVAMLAASAQEMSTGNISLAVPVEKTPQEFRTLAETIERMRVSQKVLIHRLKIDQARTATAARRAAA